MYKYEYTYFGMEMPEKDLDPHGSIPVRTEPLQSCFDSHSGSDCRIESDMINRIPSRIIHLGRQWRV